MVEFCFSSVETLTRHIDYWHSQVRNEAGIICKQIVVELENVIQRVVCLRATVLVVLSTRLSRSRMLAVAFNIHSLYNT